MGNSASQIGYLSMQTWILKIDCSCEKCQKDVVKVLLKIDAVHAVSIEPGGQKATVIGTLASADVLLKTLQKKCGKKAELWPVTQNKQKNESKTQIQRREQNSGKDVGGDKKEDTVIAQRDMQRNEAKTQNQHGEQNSGKDVRDHKKGARREMQGKKPKDPKQQTEQKLVTDGAGNAGNDGGGNANDNAAVAQGKMQNKTLKTQKEQNSGRHEDNGQVEEDLVSTGRQKVFKMEALEVATDNFDKNNKVGEGGFGAVYKGTTHDRKQIAVKKMSLTSNEGRKQFKNEKLLVEVRHRNLVNLLGFCEQESQGFLVYEYLPNKSLNKFIFDPENRKRLDWHKRYNIIQGMGRGLQYLHEDSPLRIVHGDIKSSNILLDEKLNPKIADFGTAKLLPEDRTHVTATRAVGTYGYMPPEYVMMGKLSVRTDVYSFGIVLLELLTGEKISLESLQRVWDSYKGNKVVQTIDPTIIETCDKEKALRCIQVGLLCIEEDPLLRPTMAEVNAMLSTSQSLPVPKKPPPEAPFVQIFSQDVKHLEPLSFLVFPPVLVHLESHDAI